MPSKLVYSENIPAEVLPAVKAKLEKYEKLIPSWTQEVRVYWNGAPGGDATISGSSDGNFAYRWATISICPAFLDEKDSEREDTAIHELSHVLLFPLTDFFDQLLCYFDEQPEKVKDFMKSQLMERIEGVTVDLTSAVLRLMKREETDTTKEVGPKKPAKKKRSTTRKKK